MEKKLSVLKRHFSNPIVLGIPRGGLAVGYCISKALEASLDAIVLRKLPIPANPEAGFGAVSVDKTVVLNETMLTQLNLDQAQIDKIINNVYKEVLRRNKIYRKDRPFPSLVGRSVIVADDGLATGFTMLAAVRFIRKNKPKDIIVAVPVAHREAYNLVRRESDRVVALHVSDLPYFAVASFYDEFPQMSDEEVRNILKE